MKFRMFFPLLAATVLASTASFSATASAQSAAYLGTYAILGSECVENGQATGRAKAAVRFEFHDSAVGRIFQEIDNADGVKGTSTYFFDGGRSPFGAGEFAIDENANHFMAFAHRKIDGVKWIEKTESFEITHVKTDAFMIKVTRLQTSNYTRNNSEECTFATKRKQ